jgi:uncharacterized DUF497 family protein
MGIKISAHAAEKAAERGITEEGIRAILDESPAVLIPSKSDPCADIVLGKYADNVWAVIFNYDASNVITVRRASKIERMVYEQEKGN